MRLAVVDNLPEGGAKKVVEEQVARLKENHQILYLHDIREIPRYRGISRPITELGLVTKLRSDYQKMSRRIEEFGAEVIIAHPDKYTQAPWILAETKRPTIYFAEEWLRVSYEPEWHPVKANSVIKTEYERLRRELIRQIDKYLIHQAAMVVTTSEFNTGHLRAVYGVDAYVINLAVDFQYFKPVVEEQRKAYFLYFGEPDNLHGFDLLTAIKEIAPSEMQLKIVAMENGRWPYTQDEIRNLYQGAVATLCLDRNEPFGLIPLESMACETPVIAVNEGGYRETVDDGVTGYLVLREAKVIYELMKKLAINPQIRIAMGQAGRLRVRENFGWKKHIHKLEAILGKVKP